MSGVLITKGMKIAVPVGGMKISLNSQEEMQVNVVVHYDVCPKWLEISLEHLLEAEKSKKSLTIAWNKNKENKIDFLEEEFTFSMQSIMAASIAIDAFYSSIKEFVEIPQSLTEIWRKKRTSRHAQIGEVLRRAFILKPNGTKNLRKFLQDIFKLRDLAVHPSGKLEEPILHPELDVAVEWRFVYFSYERAKNILMATLEIMWQLINSKNVTNPKITDHCKSLIQLLAPVYEKWKCNYGSIEAIKEKNVENK
jgi:hypothetical protein